MQAEQDDTKTDVYLVCLMNKGVVFSTVWHCSAVIGGFLLEVMWNKLSCSYLHGHTWSHLVTSSQ